jgi:diguanylate cyclase (GGDEF)-like protein
MSAITSIECKYESFNALVKINDPELLLEVFLDQLAPHHTQVHQVEIFERFGTQWRKVIANGCTTLEFDAKKRSVLENRIDPEAVNAWFYDSDLQGWLCAYKPLTNKQFALFLGNSDSDPDLDEEYVQLLFSFYCHQLRSLEGTYRDSLTGLYNRRSFDQRMTSLLGKHNLARRRNQSTPSVFVMLDIDHFKLINDEYGHLYGDEVLAIVARIMADSFREYDLLFRYGGEEFAAVLMDLDDVLAVKALERFRASVEHHAFPRNHPVTISIGYTTFDDELSTEQMIDQADKALYFCKRNGRNQVSRYDH